MKHGHSLINKAEGKKIKNTPKNGPQRLSGTSHSEVFSYQSQSHCPLSERAK